MLAWIAIFSCISAFLFGYDLGLVGGALLHIQSDLGASDAALSAIVGAAKLGAVAGTVLGAALMLYYGRRPAIAVDSAFFVAGPLVMAGAWGVSGLVAGRVIVGLGIGVSAVVVPAYLAEVAPARLRGRTVELYELMLCLGMLAAALADAALDGAPAGWRWMVGLPAVPGALMAVAAWALPESPRWLVTHGRLDEALGVIHRVYTSSTLPRGTQGSTAEVEAELMDLWSAVEKAAAEAADRRARHAEARRARQQARQRPRRASPPPGLPPAPPRAGSPQGGGGGGGRLSRASGSSSGASRLSRSSSSGALDEEVVAVPTRLPRIRTRSTDRLNLLGEERVMGAAALDPGGGVPAPGAAAQHQQQQPRGEWERGGGGLHDGSPAPLASPSPPAHTRAASDVPWSAAASAASAAAARGGGGGGGGGPGFWATAWDMVLDIYIVARGPERGALRIALALAFFNQSFASTAIINYAPAVLRAAGVESGAAASLLTSLIGGAKLVGVAAAFCLVDSAGRRPLLLWGSFGCAAALAALAPADAANSPWLLLAGMCAFMLAFSMSWAGVFWVLVSEMFSMGAKSPAAAAATAALFLTGAVADLLFLALHRALGPYVFLVYSGIAAAAGVYVLVAVPETKGRTLLEVQALLEVGPRRQGGSGGERGGEREGLVAAGSVRSVELPITNPAPGWR